MARTIKMSNGGTYSGEYWKFTDKDDYVIYRDSLLKTTKIMRSNIVSDQKSYFPDIFPLAGGAVLTAIIFAALFKFFAN